MIQKSLEGRQLREEQALDVIEAVQDDTSIDWESLDEMDILAAWRKHTRIEGEVLGTMFLSAYETAIGVAKSEELHFDTQGWRIKIAAPLAKSAFILSILAVGLRSVNATDLPAALLTAILPLLLDIERVKILRKDEELYLRLALSADGLSRTGEELYELLTPKQRDDISLLEFQDLLDRLRQAGLLDLSTKHSLLRPEQFDVHQPTEPRFRITFE
jgi:hypothetical protein